MSASEILKQIKRLSQREQLLIVEQTIHYLRDKTENDILTTAAESLADEYRTNQELTDFTSLDFENFYEIKIC